MSRFAQNYETGDGLIADFSRLFVASKESQTEKWHNTMVMLHILMTHLSIQEEVMDHL